MQDPGSQSLAEDEYGACVPAQSDVCPSDKGQIQEELSSDGLEAQSKSETQLKSETQSNVITKTTFGGSAEQPLSSFGGPGTSGVEHDEVETAGVGSGSDKEIKNDPEMKTGSGINNNAGTRPESSEVQQSPAKEKSEETSKVSEKQGPGKDDNQSWLELSATDLLDSSKLRFDDKDLEVAFSERAELLGVASFNIRLVAMIALQAILILASWAGSGALLGTIGTCTAVGLGIAVFKTQVTKSRQLFLACYVIWFLLGCDFLRLCLGSWIAFTYPSQSLRDLAFCIAQLIVLLHRLPFSESSFILGMHLALDVILSGAMTAQEPGVSWLITALCVSAHALFTALCIYQSFTVEVHLRKGFKAEKEFEDLHRASGQWEDIVESILAETSNCVVKCDTTVALNIVKSNSAADDFFGAEMTGRPLLGHASTAGDSFRLVNWARELLAPQKANKPHLAPHLNLSIFTESCHEVQAEIVAVYMPKRVGSEPELLVGVRPLDLQGPKEPQQEQAKRQNAQALEEDLELWLVPKTSESGRPPSAQGVPSRVPDSHLDDASPRSRLRKQHKVESNPAYAPENVFMSEVPESASIPLPAVSSTDNYDLPAKIPLPTVSSTDNYDPSRPPSTAQLGTIFESPVRHSFASNRTSGHSSSRTVSDPRLSFNDLLNDPTGQSSSGNSQHTPSLSGATAKAEHAEGPGAGTGSGGGTASGNEEPQKLSDQSSGSTTEVCHPNIESQPAEGLPFDTIATLEVSATQNELVGITEVCAPCGLGTSALQNEIGIADPTRIMDMQRQHDQIPLDATGALTSLGTIGHPYSCEAACKYHGTRRGCKEDVLCPRCHLCRWKKQRKPAAEKAMPSPMSREVPGAHGQPNPAGAPYTVPPQAPGLWNHPMAMFQSNALFDDWAQSYLGPDPLPLQHQPMNINNTRVAHCSSFGSMHRSQSPMQIPARVPVPDTHQVQSVDYDGLQGYSSDMPQLDPQIFQGDVEATPHSVQPLADPLPASLVQDTPEFRAFLGRVRERKTFLDIADGSSIGSMPCGQSGRKAKSEAVFRIQSEPETWH